MSGTGIVTGIEDCGSVVMVWVDDMPLYADGNIMRRLIEDGVIDEGSEIEYQTDGVLLDGFDVL